MSNCGSFLFLLVIFLMVTSGMGLRLPFSSDRNRPWRQLAREFGGVFTGGGMFVAPTLRFTYGSRRATVTARKGVTTLTMMWPIVDLECDIVSRDGGGRRWTTLLPEVTMEDEAFDRRYRVYTRDAATTRSLLSTGVLAAIEKLVGMRFTAPVRVSFRPGQLTIVKRASLSGYPVLLLFIRTCLELFDQAMLTRAEGIDFSNEQLADDFRPLDDARCQVCGDVIAEHDLVSCRRCHTPHHQECWDYYGSCTVYGCQEADYELPQTPTLIRYITPGDATEHAASDETTTSQSENVVDDLEIIDSPATAEADNRTHGDADGAQAGDTEVQAAERSSPPPGDANSSPNSSPSAGTRAPIVPHDPILTEDDGLSERTSTELDHEGS